MASNGLTINLNANVTEAVKGVSKVADSLDEVADTLHDLTRESDRTTGDLEDDLRKVQRASDKTSDVIKAKMADAYRSVRKNSDDAADDAVRSQGRISEKSAEVGDEVRQNLGEGIANAARGDFSSLSDTIGDTLGGITAGIGGIGTAAIGVVGAVGLGAILGVLQQGQEEANKLGERLADAYRGAAEEGRAYLDQAAIIANAQDLMFNPDRKGEYQKVLDTQKVTGLELADLLKANAGDLDAMATVSDRLDEVRRKWIAEGGEANVFEELFGGNSLNKLKDYWDGAATAAEGYEALAADSLRSTTRLLLDEIDAAAGATRQTNEFGQTLYTLPDGKEIVVDAKTGQATTDVNTFKGEVDKIPAEKAVTVRGTVDLSQVERDIRNFRSPTINIRGEIRTANGRIIE